MFYFSQTSVIIIQNFWEAKVTLYSRYEKPVDSNTFLSIVPHKFVLRPFNGDKLVNSIKSLIKASMLILKAKKIFIDQETGLIMILNSNENVSDLVET